MGLVINILWFEIFVYLSGAGQIVTNNDAHARSCWRQNYRERRLIWLFPVLECHWVGRCHPPSRSFRYAATDSVAIIVCVCFCRVIIPLNDMIRWWFRGATFSGRITDHWSVHASGLNNLCTLYLHCHYMPMNNRFEINPRLAEVLFVTN